MPALHPSRRADASASSLESGWPGLAAVPSVVRRYLELALPRADAWPRQVVLEQHGELRTSPTSGRWMRFTATHTIVPHEHRFLWNARVAIAPLVHLRVLDALRDGRGSGDALLLSVYRVAHDSGSAEMNAGSLHRFLAEAVWYPWALLPDEHLRWAPIDPHRAMATLTAGGVSVELEFRFADGGEVLGIYTPSRWGSFGGRYARAAWEGRFSGYERRDGFLVPRHGEVGWYHAGALQLVWRGTIDRMSVR